MHAVVNSSSTRAGAIIVMALLTIAMTWPGCARNVPPAATNAGVPPTHTQRHDAPRNGTVSITGLVKQPIQLDLNDLRNYHAVQTRLNDVHQDTSFYGVHNYLGVPLRVLLEQAVITKASAVFNREMDLTIVVRNRRGDTVALSWGEIFYRNPSNILLAYEAEPHIPHKACSNCHDESTYKPWQDMLLRDIPLPKLVVANDFYSDRALEEVSSIEVVYLGREKGINVAREDRPDKLYAPEIVLNQGDTRQVIRAIDKYPRTTADAIKAGDGTGYHGVRHYSGVSLRDVLSDHGVAFDPREVFLLSAPDGYRVVLSSAELMLAQAGKQILLADTVNGEKLEESGRFQLVIPHDIPADRWLQAVAQIDILRIVN